MDNLKNRSIKGFIWDFFGVFSVQGIGLIISIFLARILEPEDFGLVGMVLVVISVSQIFIDMGFSSGLIQKKNVSADLYSSVFWLNIGLGAIFTILVFFSARPIASFYERSELTDIVRFLSFVFIISSLGIIQNIRYVKQLDFRTKTIIFIVSNGLSGIIAIIIAYIGFGVWALVWQNISIAVIRVAFFWMVSKWKPKFHFSIEDIKSIWGYSSKQFLNMVLSTIFQKLDIVMIGKIFQASLLGYYTRAKSLDTLINNFSSGSLKKVFFPMISKLQDEISLVGNVYKKSMLLTGFISIGLTCFLYIVAKDLFIILYTEKWNYSADLFKIMAIVGFTFPLSTIMINVILGLGHSGKNLVLGLWKKLIGLLALVVGFVWGIEAFLYACIARNLLGLTLNMFFVKRLIGIKIITQYKWIIKPIIIAVFLAITIDFVDIENIYYSFILRSCLFITGYLFLIYLLDKEISTLIHNQLKYLLQNARNRNRK